MAGCQNTLTKDVNFLNNVQIQQNQHYPSVDHPSMPLCSYIHINVQRTLFCIQLYTNQKLQI